ncbi:neogenin-like [Paramacrobiotus metropolitanus]|uniref:neogenin-like n=1 Tax=Paramacrobiotus metropolitanus TaxID=2943436 RepID=UPI0024459E41|nr:neogenin-like [Paramacrobiotus metropolitanus]
MLRRKLNAQRLQESIGIDQVRRSPLCSGTAMPYPRQHLRISRGCQCLWALRPLAQIVMMYFGIIRQSALASAGNGQNKIKPFYFTTEPADVTAVRDRPLLLNCSTSSQPDAHVQWKRDEVPISLAADGRRSVLSNGSLFFTKIVHSRTDRPDEGIYQCTVTNNIGTIVSRAAKLQIASLPAFEDEPQNQHRIEGQTARFACNTPALPSASVTWYRDDRPVILDARMFILPSGALEIGGVRAADAGNYKCKAENADGSKFSSVGRLTVDTDPDPDAELQAPVFSMRPKQVTVLRGGKAVMECAAYGYPVPAITWLKNGLPVDTRNTRFSILGVGNLQIDNAQLDDAGQYKCRAENSADIVESSASLEIHEMPVFIKRPVDTYGQKDSDVLLECEIRGAPEPTIQWYKNGDMVIPSDYFQIDNGRNLRILGLVKSDGGVYQCFGSNVQGTVQATAQLVVLDADGTMPVFHNIPAPRVGSASSLTNVPSSPRNVVTHLISSRFVTLTWQAPATTNIPLLTYSVYYKQEGSTRERVFNTSAANKEANIQGLRPDTNYAFRVVAYNRHGPGESSEEVLVRTHPEVDVPGPVNNFRVYPLSTTEIKLEWDRPHHGSGSIQKYRISYGKVGAVQPSQELDTEKQQYILTNLNPYTEYAVTVVAFNENGPGVSSTDVHVRTHSDVPSAPPENVVIEPTSANSITIRWEPPLTASQNGVITGYKIRYRNKSTKKTEVATVDGNRRTHTITSLERGQPYLFRISAATVNGTGPPTEWLTGETFRDDVDELKEPGMPKITRARATAKSIIISWSPPSDSNVVVRGYTIGWGIGIPDVYTKLVDSKERFYSIEDLEPGSEYVISLRAFNNMGDGRPTYESVTTRLPSAPAEPATTILPPVGLQAQVISESMIIVRWTDSSLPNGQPPSDSRFYTIRYSKLHGDSRPKTIDSTDLECPISGLRPNTQYIFEVRVTRGGMQSTWSLSVVNRTAEAAPSSAPLDLTVMSLANNPTAVMINYSPPELPNGLITGYVIFYTVDNSQHDRDWAVEPVVGDKLTTVIRGLLPNTKYYFKITARNSKGYGPPSAVVSFITAPPDADPRAYSDELLQFGSSHGIAMNTLYIIIAIVASVTAVVIVIIISICCWRKHKAPSNLRKGTNGYKAGSKKNKAGQQQTDLKAPDLWMHHHHHPADNVELKHVAEKSPHEIVPILKHSNEYTNNINLSATLDRLQKRTNSFVDIKNNIDGRGYNDMNKFNSLSRRTQRPFQITLDQHSQKEPITNVVGMPNNTANNAARINPPDSMQRNIFPLRGGQPVIGGGGGTVRLPTIECSPHQSLASPDPSTPSTFDAGSSGAAAQGSSDTLRSASHRVPHPLKSFSVPAPPPQHHHHHVNGAVAAAGAMQPAVTTPRHLAAKPLAQISVPPVVHPPLTAMMNGSPYKRAPMTVPIQNQPKAHKPPVTFADLPRKEDGRSAHGYSTEELSQEMANLEGLMKDLNAITASEFINC